MLSEGKFTMKKISPQNKLSNSTAFNALLICGIALMSQIPRRCGFIAVYAVPLLWLLFILNSAYMTYVLIRSRDDSGVNEHFGRYRVICILTLICCLVMSVITIPFVKDSINGTEIFKTSYYQIFSKSKELLIYYPDGQDRIIYLTKSQLGYIDNNCTEIDKNHTLKVSDAMSVYAHTKAITVEFYPNSGIAKSIEIKP